MSRNRSKSGTTEAELLLSVERAIRSALPVDWAVELDRLPEVARSRHARPDARLAVTAPDGARAVVLVECRGVVAPRDVASVADRLDDYARAVAHRGEGVGGAVLVSPFVSPTTRDQLERRGLGWFDTTGNLRLRLDRPAVFIDRAGADRSGFRDPADRSLKSLRGAAAAKVVLELCETPLPVGVRDLAERAGVGAATSARALALLDREAALVRNDEGAVVSVRKRALLDRWVRDYGVMTSNEVVATLDPRGLDHALGALRSSGARAVLTGSAAARLYLPDDTTPVTPLLSVSLYAEDPVDVMGQLGLRTVERGMNVLVLRAHDDVVHTRSRLVDGVAVAAPAQVVADLLTGPGRSSEEAEQLLAVLAASEPGWEA